MRVRLLHILSCALLGASCGPTDDDSRRHVASASCPLRTPHDWQSFLESTVDDQRWVTTCSDHDNCDELVGGFAARVQIEILAVLALCEDDTADNPPIAECTANLRRYVPAWLQQHTPDSHGFRQDDATYQQAQTSPENPVGMMDPPGELMAAFPGRTTLEDAARTRGWPYLIHDSALGGVRLFVNVPDAEDRFDQWIAVGLDQSAAAVHGPAILSFIAVQKKTAGGAQLDRVRLHFRDYLISDATPSWKAELPEAFGGKCYACHGSGVRQLIPQRGSIASALPVNGEPDYPSTDVDVGMSRLAALNERLRSYGLPDWNGTIEPSDHGPPLGKDLGCTLCHNGGNRGVLTVSTSEGMLRQKVLDQLSMRSPHGGKDVPDVRAMALLERETTGEPPLTIDEKAELADARAEHSADYEAIVAERFPAWRAWMLSSRCE